MDRLGWQLLPGVGGGKTYLPSSRLCTTQVLNSYSLLRSENRKGVTLGVTEMTSQ